MKRSILIVLLLFQFVAWSQEITSGKLEKTIISPDSADTSLLAIDYMFYSDPQSAYEIAVNDQVKVFLQYDGKKKSKLPLNKAYVQKKLDDFAATYNEYAEETEGVIWDLEEAVRIEEFESWVQLSLSGWSYEGGAHGNGGISSILYDKEDGRELKIEDFITDVDALNKLLDPVFRDYHGLDADANLEEAGFLFDGDTFQVNDNFWFTGRSIVVYFNTYEITDYAGGPTEVEISLGEIEHLLKREL